MTDSRNLSDELRDRIADYVDGRMTSTERADFERQMLEDDVLMGALYSEQTLRDASVGIVSGDTAVRTSVAGTSSSEHAPGRPVATSSGSREQSRIPTGPGLWERLTGSLAIRWAVPAAALLALVLFIPRAFDDSDPGDIFRGPESSVRGLVPLGTLSAPPDRFLWTADPRADSYRIEVYGPNSALLFQAVSTDTALGIEPGSISWDERESGFWRVVPLNGAHEFKPSPPVRFEFENGTP